MFGDGLFVFHDVITFFLLNFDEVLASGWVWFCVGLLLMQLTYRSIILGEVIFRIKFCEASVQWAAQLDLEFASQLFVSLYSHWA